MAFTRLVGLAAATVAVSLALSGPSRSETILDALAKAYQYNSELNAARAGVRVTNESVAIARSGYRPTIEGVADIDHTTQSGVALTTGSFGVRVNQMLFDGFQTRNNVAAAEARVRASFENLRNVEQNILFNAATAYVDVLSARQVAVLRERNLEFLDEQVRAARSRFEVGEGTRTDVAQADAQRALAIAELTNARAQARTSEATYREVVGDPPGRLAGVSPLTKLLPGSDSQAFTIALREHPAILYTQLLVDAAGFTVKSAEGAMLPGVSLNAGISSNFRQTHSGGPMAGGQDGSSTSASIGATLTVPIYQGGRASAQVRQSKESLGQARIQVDVSRDDVRNAVTSAWFQYVGAQEESQARREAISAAQLALNGVIEERNVGQRTTLDVLNAQAEVITNQILLVDAERNLVVASYAILSGMGRLTVDRLGLGVQRHRPEEHYHAVKNKWYGTRTPDGR